MRAEPVGVKVSNEMKIWSCNVARMIKSVDDASLCDTQSFGGDRDIYQVLLDLDSNVRQYKENMVCNAVGRTISEAHRVAERS